MSYHLSKVLEELKHLFSKEISQVLLAYPNTLNSSNEKLLKDIELCDLLQISTSHFYKLKKANADFPVYDFDGAKRYKLSEVEQFFKNKKHN